MPAPAQPEVFVSYSHHDAPWRDRLIPDFMPTTAGNCRIWSDARLRAGDAWAEEIDRRLERCTVAVLLTSPKFLASRFIGERELPRILQRARDGSLRLVWIPIALGAAELQAQQPALAAIQAAGLLKEPLPAEPWGLGEERVLQLQERLREALQAAVDPLGGELAKLLAKRYTLRQRLGEGNRATVYRAHDRMLARDVAIKVLKDPEQQRREAFMADVRRAIQLSEEPNFINLYDCAPDHTLAFCVQQMVEGRTLRDRLAELPADRPLPVALLRDIFTKLTRAIARAHARGVTYGNLKPGNIILDAEDEPFILPVGRRRDEPRDERRIQALVERLGRAREQQAEAPAADAEDLAYLVPDQFGDPVQPVDPTRVDQYMLGLIGWQMVTGQRPQAVAEPRRLLELGRGAFRELPPIRTLRPLAPRRLEALLARMTARRARERFDDLKAVVRELDSMPDLGLLVVLDSWRRIVADPQAEQRLFRRFYERFLARAPQARAHFAHFGEADWPRQHQLLKEAVLLLIAFHQQADGDAEPHVLSRLAASHRQIPARLYDPFREALIDSLCGDPADDLEPADPLCRSARDRDALEEQWRAALEPGIRWLAAQSGR